MELDLDNLRGLRVLGRGAMGTVFLVADRPSSGSATATDTQPPPPPFALKVVEKRHEYCTTVQKQHDVDRRARWEVSVLSQLSYHPFLPTLLGSAETPDLILWALPFYSGGDLNALRYSLPEKTLSPAALRFYLAEVVAALAHLHSLGIVYRDLKPENLLLRADGHLILSDFDLSRHLSRQNVTETHACKDSLQGQHRRRRNLTSILFPPSAAAAAAAELKKAKSSRVSPSSRNTSFSGAGERSYSFVGTEEYVAPEVVRGEGHEFAVDWWALGVLAYELAFGVTPFRGRNRKETFKNVLTKNPEFSGRRKRSDLEDLVIKLLTKDPERRLGSGGGASEVMAHAFFAGVQWDLLEEIARPPYFPENGTDDKVNGEGFDIRDYFKKLRQREAELAASPPPEVLDEF